MKQHNFGRYSPNQYFYRFKLEHYLAQKIMLSLI
jgi:hypothetical protein